MPRSNSDRGYLTSDFRRDYWSLDKRYLMRLGLIKHRTYCKFYPTTLHVKPLAQCISMNLTVDPVPIQLPHYFQ